MKRSITFGFHRRKSAPGAKAALAMEGVGSVCDEECIFARSAAIQVAFDAGRQAFPEETPFSCEPFRGREDERWFNATTAETVFRDRLYEGPVDLTAACSAK